MKNGEKQVYPLQSNNGTILQTGLTKREYFAGLAMQGILSNQQLVGYLNAKDDSEDAQLISKAAVFVADKLLKQLENETTK